MPQDQQTASTEEAAPASAPTPSGPSPKRRRLRSSTVILGGMGALAATLSACSSEPDKRCVDRNSYSYDGSYKVLSPSKCRSGSSTSSGGGAAGGFGSGRKSDPQWYYDSKGGSRADSGTFSKSVAVDRGGFGCSGRSGSSGG